MFKVMQNVDSAFRYIRMVSVVVIAGSIVLNLYLVYRSYDLAKSKKEKVYVLVNGKALEAYASERKDNLAVEAKDHIKTFHNNFFTLSPDEKAIEASIGLAMNLADQSAKKIYDDLKEGNYYSGIISSNINQTLSTDSIQLDMNTIPFGFKYYGVQTLTRPTSVLTRSIVTSGYLREINRSENNPHGFLVERWTILENKDLAVTPR